MRLLLVDDLRVLFQFKKRLHHGAVHQYQYQNVDKDGNRTGQGYFTAELNHTIINRSV